MPMHLCRLLAVLAAGLVLAAASPAHQGTAVTQPGGTTQPETAPPTDAAAFFARVRAAYTRATVTERLRISIQQVERTNEGTSGGGGGGVTRRSLLLVRTEPATDGSGIRRIVIRAGRLLIDAEAGAGNSGAIVRAATDSRQGPLFESAATERAIASALSLALPPLPIAQLDLTAPAEGPPHQLAAYARGITWSEAPTQPRAGEARIDGRFEGGAIIVTADQTTWRLRRVQVALDAPAGGGTGRGGGAMLVVEHAPSTARLAGIEALGPDGSPRKRVSSPSALMAGLPVGAVGTPLALAPGSESGELLQGATRGPDGRPRPAVVLLVGAPGPEHESAARTLAALAEELAAGTEPGTLGLAIAWNGPSTDTPAWLELLNPRAGAMPILSGGVERAGDELARIAPGASGAFVVVAPDREILAVFPLEQLSADSEQQVAELLMSLLDALHTTRTPIEHDPR